MAKRTVVLLLLEETDDPPVPHDHARDIDTDLEEVSRVVESIRPGLARAVPRSVGELARKVGGR